MGKICGNDGVLAMEKVIVNLQNALKDHELVVYVDDDFKWKDAAKERLEGDSRVLMVHDAEFMEVYRSYEFSDKFVVLSESEQYGSIWNYVRNGIITVDEAFDQLIGSKFR